MTVASSSKSGYSSAVQAVSQEGIFEFTPDSEGCYLLLVRYMDQDDRERVCMIKGATPASLHLIFRHPCRRRHHQMGENALFIFGIELMLLQLEARKFLFLKISSLFTK